MIIIDRIDRFARWWTVCETLYLDLAVKGIDVVRADVGENMTQSMRESPVKKFIIHVLGGVAELDYSTICERLKRGREKKRKNTGKCGGPTIYGDCDKNCIEGKHSPRCERERMILDRITQMRMRKPRPVALKKIARILNEEKLTPRTADAWNAPLLHNVLNGKTA
jgi:DNA invertase Pin-like site-specific DNA recombinase